ncbi:phosphoribosylanthranilate isomerase [Solitalea koreensis]|uniref:N-(5'-phosphoribosyl)anthranilate isomerase n=1 Tax=Solitalea koreensis TaxID=543615 RepID=A0A521BQA8_9SPHI|nr:phosphoribosylanthranilate isomerase [Solitalea koreensis]SMO49354.1 phosphoribosylanthranilate isomerase [Solitalea koreensis]
MKIKICGMKHAENIVQVAALVPDYLGFIFYPKSPRYFDKLELLKAVPAGVKKVAVFVNAKLEDVMEIVADHDFDAVQLHGKENADYCNQLRSPGVEVIKSFGVDKDFDFAQLKKYQSACDYFLFDTKTVDHGGSGETFDWSILKQYDNKKPFFLSGGINAANIEEIVQLKVSGLNIYGIDFNSKLETEPGLKDFNKVSAVFSEMQKAENH